MNNLWGFLLQTISVSLTAALLLIVKYLLADKLSPRWQYAAWSVLALRILVPASMERFILHPIPLWLEIWKGKVEAGLNSAYSSVEQVISVKAPVPWIVTAPLSVTDWLFVLYTAGVVVTLLWYAFSYLRLRRALRKGFPVSEGLEAQIQRVCQTYGLCPCRAVAVKGLTSAFVCGVFRPVLAVPAGEELDDKVLLHELLHLKYRDSLQNLLWCVLRALHWCNPFLQVVFNRIGNDMESLCDQRVLERLEGEERRSYGVILLSMANDRYPRAPGTTSISNGGKNISRRIEAIVRFRKYPKGMALVSVCTVILLAAQVLSGSAANYAGQGSYLHPDSESESAQSMAMVRLERCTTPAAAIDTYVKGLRWENGVMVALASSASEQQSLFDGMSRNHSLAWVSYHRDPGKYLDYLYTTDTYYIANLEEQEEGCYTAVLVFGVKTLMDEEGCIVTNEAGDSWIESTVLVPITVYEEDGWVVEETGERQAYPNLACTLAFRSEEVDLLGEETVYEGTYGTLTMISSSLYCVAKTDSVWTNLAENSLDSDSLNLDGDFSGCGSVVHMKYRFNGPLEEWETYWGVTMDVKAVLTDEDGTSSAVDTFPRSETENPVLQGYSPYSYSVSNDTNESYTIAVKWNGETQEEFQIERKVGL